MVLLSRVAWMGATRGREPRVGLWGLQWPLPLPLILSYLQGQQGRASTLLPVTARGRVGSCALITSTFCTTCPPTKLLTETFRALGAWPWGSMGLVRPVDTSLDIRLAFTLRSPLLVSLFPPVILRILALPS